MTGTECPFWSISLVGECRVFRNFLSDCHCSQGCFSVRFCRGPYKIKWKLSFSVIFLSCDGTLEMALKKMQAIQERHENSLLKTEMEKLRDENKAMRETIQKSCCPNCGSATTSRDTTLTTQEQQLRIENARLKAEVWKFSAFWLSNSLWINAICASSLTCWAHLLYILALTGREAPCSSRKVHSGDGVAFVLGREWPREQELFGFLHWNLRAREVEDYGVGETSDGRAQEDGYCWRAALD